MGTFKYMHKYYNNLYKNGEFDTDGVIQYFRANLFYSAEIRTSMLKRLYSTVIEQKFMNEFAMTYIKDSNLSVRDIIERYNNGRAEADRINDSTGRSRIIYCSQIVNKAFPDVEVAEHEKKTNIVEWLMTHKTMNIEDSTLALDKKAYDTFNEQLKEFEDRFDTRSNDFRRLSIIKIPRVDKVMELSDDDFEHLMKLLHPYSRHVLHNMEDALNDMNDAVGYLNFLMSSRSVLTDTDKERREAVYEWLGNEELNDYDKQYLDICKGVITSSGIKNLSESKDSTQENNKKEQLEEDFTIDDEESSIDGIDDIKE